MADDDFSTTDDCTRCVLITHDPRQGPPPAPCAKCVLSPAPPDQLESLAELTRLKVRIAQHLAKVLEGEATRTDWLWLDEQLEMARKTCRKHYQPCPTRRMTSRPSNAVSRTSSASFG